MKARVCATPAALDVIEALRAEHGPLAFHQSGGCCDGSSPICVLAHELPPSASDRELGQIGDTPFYIDSDQDDRWGQSSFVVDVAPGAAEGFSLEGLAGVHFLTRSPAG